MRRIYEAKIGQPRRLVIRKNPWVKAVYGAKTNSIHSHFPYLPPITYGYGLSNN
jgi:hypothetical protein